MLGASGRLENASILCFGGKLEPFSFTSTRSVNSSNYMVCWPRNFFGQSQDLGEYEAANFSRLVRFRSPTGPCRSPVPEKIHSCSRSPRRFHRRLTCLREKRGRQSISVAISPSIAIEVIATNKETLSFPILHTFYFHGKGTRRPRKSPRCTIAPPPLHRGHPKGGREPPVHGLPSLHSAPELWYPLWRAHQPSRAH